jgi:hypothetical protein
MQQVQAVNVLNNYGIYSGRAVEQLKSFCRGEMSAVETYRQVIDVTEEDWIVASLRLNMASHDDRVRLLSRRIDDLGAEPPESSGAWGTLARVAEGAAAAFGERTALSLLEQGEELGLDDYRSDLSNLDAESYRLVRDMILPQQIQTHRTLVEIKQRLS